MDTILCLSCTWLRMHSLMTSDNFSKTEINKSLIFSLSSNVLCNESVSSVFCYVWIGCRIPSQSTLNRYQAGIKLEKEDFYNNELSDETANNFYWTFFPCMKNVFLSKNNENAHCFVCTDTWLDVNMIPGIQTRTMNISKSEVSYYPNCTSRPQCLSEIILPRFIFPWNYARE